MDVNYDEGFWGFCGKECPSDPHDGINVIFLDKDFPSTVKPVNNSHPPMGPEKCGRYAEDSLKKISGK